MKKIVLVGALCTAFIFSACGDSKNANGDQASANEAQTSNAKGLDETQIGLREVALLNDNITLKEYSYEQKAAGESTKIERSYENAPPMISHSVADMEITKEANACLDCHAPDVAEAVGAVSVPTSHQFHLRNNKKLAKVDDTRWNCVSCHVTQVNAQPLVQNTFNAEFRQEDSKTKSNLLDVLNDGVK